MKQFTIVRSRMGNERKRTVASYKFMSTDFQINKTYRVMLSQSYTFLFQYHGELWRYSRERFFHFFKFFGMQILFELWNKFSLTVYIHICLSRSCCFFSFLNFVKQFRKNKIIHEIKCCLIIISDEINQIYL